MYAEISFRDEKGVPVTVYTDDGFAQCSRPYKEAEDGWIEDQLDPNLFEAIHTGRQMEQLVSQVNQLKRENFYLKQEVKRWQKASGMFAE